MKKRTEAFTLIEILISVAILAILSAIIASIIFLILRSTSKTSVSKEVKQNGEGAAAIIQEFVRNAETVSSCEAEKLSVLNSDGRITSFYCDGTEKKIASESANMAWLTNRLVVCSDFSVSCQPVDGSWLVSFSFSLSPVAGYPVGSESHFSGKVFLVRE